MKNRIININQYNLIQKSVKLTSFFMKKPVNNFCYETNYFTLFQPLKPYLFLFYTNRKTHYVLKANFLWINSKSILFFPLH